MSTREGGPAGPPPPPPAAGGGSDPYSSSQQHFIGGMPDSYVVPRPDTSYEFHQGDPRQYPFYRGNIQQYSPLYHDGQEFDAAQLSVEDLARLQAKLAAAGLIGPKEKVQVGLLDDVTLNAYRKLLGFANRYAVDENTALGMLVDNAAAAKKVLQPVQTSTSTNRSVSLTDPMTAHAVLRRTLTDELGRAPTDDEYQQFLGSLNADERANPTVSTTTSTYDPNTGHTDTSTTTQQSGAPSPEVFADEAAHRGKLGAERNVKMAATDYYAAAMAALGPGGGRLQ